MDTQFRQVIFHVGRFFCSEIYAYYQDTYKGVLGKVQVETLDYIHLKKQVGIKELSQRLNISKQHASKIAQKLETLGYAQKVRNPDDGRACLYSLTDSGKKFIQEHIALSDQYFEEWFNSLSEENKITLRECLTKAADIICDHKLM